MKRISFIVLLLVCVVTLTFAGCTETGESNSAGGNEDLEIGTDNGQTPEPDGGEEPEGGTEEVIQYDVLLYALTNGLNIRSGAGSSYKVVGSLDKGDAVMKLGEPVNGWYPTIYKEKKAYVSAKYVAEMKFEMSDNGRVERVIEEGKKLLGHPYVWGSQRYHWGNGNLNPSFKAGEFDCSALMQYIFYKGAGVNLELTTRTQVVQGREIARSEIQRGDMIFFTNSSRYNNTGVERIGHVALYLGNNYILHTATDHAVIEPISSLRWSYYIVTKRVTE